MPDISKANSFRTVDASASSYVTALDGLRALAIFAVLAVHAGFPGAQAGWLGVDLFFTLSGFLITTLICREIDKTGTFNFKAFWIRRSLRIFPAYYAYIAIITIMIYAGAGTLTTHHGYTPALYVASLWLYFINYIPQGSIWSLQMLTLHLWSLAVEEQFYLIWPLLFYFIKNKNAMLYVSIAMTIAVLVVCIVTTLSIQNLLYIRGLPIFFGCTAALLISGRNYRASNSALLVSVWLSAILTTAIGILLTMKYLEEEAAHHYIVPIASLCYAFMIGSLWTCHNNTISKILSISALVFIGRISYGIYLYHMAVHQLTWEVLLASIDDWPSVIKFPIRVAVYLLLTITLAALSHRYYEKPILALKERCR